MTDDNTYLYKEENSEIKVFELNEKKDAIEYREKELMTMPEEDIILKAYRHANHSSSTPFFEQENLNDLLLLNTYLFQSSGANGHERLYSQYWKLTLEERERLLSSYYLGSLKRRRVVMVKSGENEYKYLLPTQDKYVLNPRNCSKMTMPKIISLPKSLYILQMIEQGDFEALKDFDIKKQLELFELKLCDSIEADKIKKMDLYGISLNAYNQIVEKANQSEKVLKYFM